MRLLLCKTARQPVTHGYVGGWIFHLKGTKTTNTPPNQSMFTPFKGQNPKAVICCGQYLPIIQAGPHNTEVTV